jgi:hypothetical protein
VSAEQDSLHESHSGVGEQCRKSKKNGFSFNYSMIFHTKFWRIFFFTLMFFECIRDFSPSYFIDSFTGASVQLRNRGKKRKWLGSVPISFSGDIK